MLVAFVKCRGDTLESIYTNLHLKCELTIDAGTYTKYIKNTRRLVPSTRGENSDENYFILGNCCHNR